MKSFGEKLQLIAAIVEIFGLIGVVIGAVYIFGTQPILNGIIYLMGGILAVLVVWAILHAIGEFLISANKKDMFMLADYYLKLGQKDKAEWIISQYINETKKE